MTSVPDSPNTLRWLDDGESLLRDWVVTGSDDLRRPSLLPDWSRAHVVAHLIGNAVALGNLLTWARTGTETPMYADAEARRTQIDVDARRPDAWLRSRLGETGATLQAQYRSLTPAQSAVVVRTAQGRLRPARQVAWMRVRESFLHLVDLNIGYSFKDLPPALVDALIDDVVGVMSARPSVPAVRVIASDRDREWHLGPAGDPAPATVTDRAPELLRWLTGRPPRSDVDRERWPTLPAWL